MGLELHADGEWIHIIYFGYGNDREYYMPISERPFPGVVRCVAGELRLNMSPSYPNLIELFPNGACVEIKENRFVQITDQKTIDAVIARFQPEKD